MREFLEAIEELECPTIPALTEEVGCSRQTTYFRMDRLEEEGHIEIERDGRPHTIELVDQ
jgi:predicted transcriptional regulator